MVSLSFSCCAGQSPFALRCAHLGRPPLVCRRGPHKPSDGIQSGALREDCGMKKRRRKPNPAGNNFIILRPLRLRLPFASTSQSKSRPLLHTDNVSKFHCYFRPKAQPVSSLAAVLASSSLIIIIAIPTKLAPPPPHTIPENQTSLETRTGLSSSAKVCLSMLKAKQRQIFSSSI